MYTKTKTSQVPEWRSIHFSSETSGSKQNGYLFISQMYMLPFRDLGSAQGSLRSIKGQHIEAKSLNIHNENQQY